MLLGEILGESFSYTCAETKSAKGYKGVFRIKPNMLPKLVKAVDNELFASERKTPPKVNGNMINPDARLYKRAIPKTINPSTNKLPTFPFVNSQLSFKASIGPKPLSTIKNPNS